MAKNASVNPRHLRLPGERAAGADPVKLARQLARFGPSIAGMPPVQVTRGANGEMMIMDGVTRATRVAKMLPGLLIRVLITEELPNKDYSGLPTIGDTLP
jgi:hypothetical protein